MPDDDEGCTLVLEGLIAAVMAQLDAANQVVRFRASQILANILHHVPLTVALDEDLLQGLGTAFLARLSDKATAVRAQAVRALGRLCEPDEVCRSGMLLQSWRLHSSWC